MSEKDDPREDRLPACGRTRGKVWTGLGTAILAGAAFSLLPQAPQAGALGKLAKSGAGPAWLIQIAGSEGGEGGESGEGREGGEGGEGGAALDLGTDEVAYLTQLGLVRGHLDVGVDLYRAGERSAALTHMKHPGDELYATLAPAFAERGVSGFAEPLERLARLVEDGAPLAEIEAAYEQVRQGIAAAEAGAPEADIAARFRVIANLVRTAAEEYDVALDDGRVVNAHEYQDALGFVRAAHAMLDALPADGVAAREAIATADAQLGGLAGLWPNLVPPATLAGDPSDLFGAAARIEIAGLHLD